MSSIESIVPPLELCKQIPEGEFTDTALARYNFHGILILRWRDNLEKLNGVRPIPAPTLEEILDDIFFTAVFCKGGIWIIDRFYEYPTESEEALRLWFKVKGIPCE